MWTWLKSMGREVRQQFEAVGRGRSGREKSRRGQRLWLETLEDRTVPAVQSVSLTNLGLLSDTAAGNVTGPASASADGRYVVYTDSAANLVPGQDMHPKSSYDVFLYDRKLGQTTLVSHAISQSAGVAETADGTSRNAVISADGNWIAYVSNSDNLIGNEILANDTYTLTMGGYTGGTFTLSYGGQATSGIAYHATAAAVQTALEGLAGVGAGNVQVSGVPGSYTITFVGALANAKSSLLTYSEAGLTGGLVNGGNGLSAFTGGQNEFLCDQYNVYLYSVQAGTNTLVSHLAGSGNQTTLSEGSSGILTGAEQGETSLASQTTSVSISGDGRYITYLSTGSLLVSGQLQGVVQPTNAPLLTRANVFVYDHSADTNYLVSREDGSPTNSAGAPTTPGDNTSYVAVISQDGSTIAFTNQSVNLVHGQTIFNYPGYGDIQGETPQFFVAKLAGSTWATATMALASHETHGPTYESITNTNGPLDYPAPVLTPNGHWLVYLSDNAIVHTPNGSISTGQGDNYYLYDTTQPNSVSNNTLITRIPGTNNEGNAGPDTFFTTTAPSAAVSDNGQYVAFYSAATNLTSTATATGYNVFLFNAANGTDTLLTHQSIPTGKFPATTYPPLTPSISGDGRYIGYIGFATADVSGLTNVNTLPGTLGLDALLYDQGPNPGTSTPTYTLLSHAYGSATTTGTGEAYTTVVSHDGSTVLYLDDSNNLLPAMVNGHTGQDLNAARPADGTDLYAYSLNTPSGYVNGNGQTDSAPNGTNATVTLRDHVLPTLNGNGMSEISPVNAISSVGANNGKFVVFFSSAPNLAPNEVDTSLTQNIYLYDYSKAGTAGATTLISHVAGSANTTANGESANAVISADGNTIVFYSYATNLISAGGAGIPAGTVQLYLYDNDPNSGTYQQVKLISHTSTATQGANGKAPYSPNGLSGSSSLLYSSQLTAQGLALPSLSSDGKYITYLSNASDLVSGSGSKINAFLYDRTQDTTTLISSGNSGTAANGNTDTVAISADGSTVAFTSKATNLIANATFPMSGDQLYVWSRIDDSATNLSAGKTVLASHSTGSNKNSPTAASFATGTASSLWGPLPASLSKDGTSVAYYFGGKDLVSTQSGENQAGTASPTNVFRYDVRNNVNELVSHIDGDSVTTGDNPSNPNLYEASGPAISADGRFIAYANNSTNLLPTQLTNQHGQDNVYFYDDSTGTNVLVSHADGSSGTPDPNGGTSPSLTADGQYVSFVDLALQDTADVFCTFTTPANVRLYKQGSGSAQPIVIGGAFNPSQMIAVGLSLAPTAVVDPASGVEVAWDGLASDVAPVPGDRNGNLDVFLSGPNTAPQAPANITVTGGNNQKITVGQSPGATVTVTVTDVNNVPVGGVTVVFTVPTTGPTGTFTGNVTTITATTDSSGVVTLPAFTANTTPGAFTITATVQGSTPPLSTAISLTNIPDAPAFITVLTGTPQSTVVATPFTKPLQVQLTDKFGNPEQTPFTITFTAPTTGPTGTFTGNVITVQVPTDATGTATAPTLTATTTAGSFTITATTPGVNTPGQFILTNTPDAPSAITVLTGTPQTTVVATTFSKPLQVQLTDQFGNPEPTGVPVTFTAPTTGPNGTFPGGVTTVQVTTDTTGVATAPTLTAATTAGSFTITATTPGVSPPASFALTNTPAAPSAITVIAGTPQSTVVGTPFTKPLQVQLVDQFGNPEPIGVPVTFTAPTTGPTGAFPGGVTTVQVTTDTTGIATAPTLTAATTAGSFTITATAVGVSPPAFFGLTSTPDVPASFLITGGSPQSTVVATAFAKPLTAQLVDQYGNAEPAGIPVTFTAPASDPSGTFPGGLTAQATTDAQGFVTAPSITADKVAGSFVVTATATGVKTPGSFALTNTSDVPASFVITGGSPQSTQVTTAFAAPLTAQLVDQYGNPEPAGIPVTFTAPGTGASGTFPGGLTAQASTDATGTAIAPALTADKVAGSYAVTVSASGVSKPGSFALTNTPGAAASITVSGSPTATTTVGTAFGGAMAVQLVDAFGNPEPAGVTVTFAAPANGASGTFAGGAATVQVVTGAGGVATAPTFTAGTVAGSFVVTVTTPGVNGGASFALTDTPDVPASFLITGGSPQSTQVTTAFATPLKAQLVDQFGNAEPAGIPVTFTAPNTGASGSFPGGLTAQASTDATGTATAPAFTADKVAGSYAVTVSASGVSKPGSFGLTNTSGAVAGITVSGSPTGATTVGTAFGGAMTVQLVDPFGNPEPAGIPVTFTAPASGPSGTFAGGATTVQVVTGAGGVATAPTFTAGTVAGSFVITVTTPGVSGGASFALTDTPDAPASFIISGGSPQSTQVTTAFATPLTAQLVDQFGNPEPAGIPVTFTAPGTGASGSFPGGLTAQASTDAQGFVTAPAFTADKVAGSYAVTVAAGVGTPGSFGLTNTSGAVAGITVSGSPTGATTVGTAFGGAMTVQLIDQFGNPEPAGIPVVFTAPATGASGTFAGGATTVQVLTGAGGLATAPAFTAGTVAGSFAVIATVPGVSGGASFALTDTPGAAANIVAMAGSPQSTFANSPFPAPLQALVTDGFGNPVGAGVTVDFVAPGSDPSGTFSGGGASVQVTTDAKGSATAPTLTAGKTDGTFTVTASVAGSSGSASFGLTVVVTPTNVVYVDPSWAGVTPGTDPDGPNGPALVFGPGGDAFATIPDAAAAVAAGGTIVIAAGTYSGPFNVGGAAVVQLVGNVTINTPGGAVIGAAVIAQTAGGADLTINAGGGSVVFSKPVGATPLGNLTILGASNVTFDGPVNLTGDLTVSGTSTVTLNGGSVGGKVDVTAGAVTFNSGTLTANTITADAATAVIVAAPAALAGAGAVVLDGGFNNPAGGSVTVLGAVTGAPVSLLGGPGNDTFTVTKITVPTTVDGGGGSDLLNVDLSAITAAQTVYVTGQAISDSAAGGPLSYKDTGGTFGKGVYITTGPGNDTVDVQSTLAGAPTVINTGAGNDTIYVASTTNLAASVISGLAGPLTIDGGPGSNKLLVSEAGTSTPDNVAITSSAIGTKNAPNAVWYKATGGNFGGGVTFIGGQGSDTYVVLSTFPGAPTTVYANGGNDTFNVGVTSASGYSSLTLDGGSGNNNLGVFDQSGSAVVAQLPSGPGIGQVKVSYLTGTPSVTSYQNMGQIGTNVDQATSYVQALYHQELGYNAGPGDLAFWIGVLRGPGGTAAVVDGIDRSLPALTRLTAGWYRTYLNRAPAGGEEQALVGRLKAGESEENVLASLLVSDEYYRLAGATDPGFIQRLFGQLLGRPANTAELSVYVNTLLPQVGRSGAVFLVLTSTDHRRVAVVAEYGQLLHRVLTRQSDIDYWALGGLSLFGIHEQLEETTDFLSANS